MADDESNASTTLIRKLTYPAFDGLRICCAMLIFMVHSIGLLMTDYFAVSEQAQASGLHNWFYSLLIFISDDSHFGTDVLFVMSGFLMARTVFYRKTGWWDFVGKRFLRLYPAFLVTLIAITLLDCYLFGYWFKAKDFALNLVLWNSIPSIDMIRYNYVTWALGFEFAFYLLVPYIGYVARVVDRRIAAGIALATAIVFIPDAGCRLVGLFAGLFVGSFSEAQLRKVVRYIPTTFVVICCLGLVVTKTITGMDYLNYYRCLIMLVSIGVICVAFGDNWLVRVLSKPSLRKLGTITYSFYLVHFICIALVLHYVVPWMGILQSPWIAVPAYFTLSFILTVAVSLLSYQLFEAPYFRMRSRKKVLRIDAVQYEAAR